jgi:hypothetical protein
VVAIHSRFRSNREPSLGMGNNKFWLVGFQSNSQIISLLIVRTLTYCKFIQYESSVPSFDLSEQWMIEFQMKVKNNPHQAL